MTIDERTPGAGVTIDGFRIASKLEREPNGIETFAVITEADEKLATLRLVPPASSAGLRAGFLRDARVLASIEHPSLPSVLALGETPDGAYAVTAHVRARSLASVIKGGGLARDRAIQMLLEAADALDAIHDAGLLHRQLRSENVVVGEWLIVRVLLVNVALGRAWGERDFIARDQVPYAAPEELRGSDVGAPADQYALAAVLFELVAGVPPFGTSLEEARHGHLHERPPDATSAVPGLPPAVDEVFERALAKDPEARYGSANALMAAIAQALAGSDELASGAEDVEQEPEPGAFAPDPEEQELEPAFVPPGPLQPVPTPSGADTDQEERLRSSGLTRARLPVPAGVGLVVAVALLGVLLGRAGGDGNNESQPRAATAGPVALRMPEGWRKVRSGTDVGGLRPQQPLAMAGSSGGRLMAGIVPGQLAAFDPRTVAQQVDGSPPPAAVVRLGRVQALRWQGLQHGSPPRPVTLFAVPTDRGAAILACSGPGSARPCQEAAASLRLRGMSAYSPVLAAQWRARVRAVIGSLRARRETELTRLAQAGTSGDHARAALALGAAHGTAIRDVTRDPVPPQVATAHRAVVSALDGLKRAYEQLGRAAQRSDAAAYSSAAEAVRRQDARLREALKVI